MKKKLREMRKLHPALSKLFPRPQRLTPEITGAGHRHSLFKLRLPGVPLIVELGAGLPGEN